MNQAIMALLDRHTVHDLITRLFVKTDERDWAGVRGCLAQSVRFDMSSVGAGPPRERTGDEIVEDWKTALAPLDSTHHQIGSTVVDIRADHEAVVTCHGVAFHHRTNGDGPDTRMYVGRCVFHLGQEHHHWKVDGIRFDLRFVEGGRPLETLPI